MELAQRKQASRSGSLSDRGAAFTGCLPVPPPTSCRSRDRPCQRRPGLCPCADHGQAVPLAAVERESGDGQGLALGTGLLHPVASSAGSVAAVATLDTTPSSPTLQQCQYISWPSVSKLSLYWMSVFSISFFRCAYARPAAASGGRSRLGTADRTRPSLSG